jgi:ABC-type sugar transport system substrate-binding protein
MPTTLTAAVHEVPLVTPMQGKLPKRVGYIVNFSFHIWYKIVMDAIRARGAQYGADVLIEDANGSATIEIAVAEKLFNSGVDVLIMTPVPEPGTEVVLEKAKAKDIPVILEANPLPGMITMLAICDYDAGVKVGKWAGEYAKKTFGGVAKILDLGLPGLRPCLLRSQGFVDGVRAVLPNAELVRSVDGQARTDVAHDVSLPILKERPDTNIIFAMDDETALGGLDAFNELGLNKSNLLVVGFGLAGDHEKNLFMSGGPWKVSAAMFPEVVGLKCVDQSIRVYNGEKVRAHEVTPTLAMTPDMVPHYFTQVGHSWLPKFDAILKIPTEDVCTIE